MTATIESVAHLIHSLRNLPQHERAASHIVKAAFELTNPDETAFILTVLGVSLASDPGAVACKVHLYIHYAHCHESIGKMPRSMCIFQTQNSRALAVRGDD